MIIETGTHSLTNTKYGEVTFTETFFTAPVVCCTLNTNGSNLGYPNIYIRNVSSTRFEVTASAKITAEINYKAMLKD